MDISRKPPIFCEDCSMLALAMLDGAPLCERCLVSKITASRVKTLTEKIAPLCIQTYKPPSEAPSRHETAALELGLAQILFSRQQ